MSLLSNKKYTIDIFPFLQGITPSFQNFIQFLVGLYDISNYFNLINIRSRSHLNTNASVARSAVVENHFKADSRCVFSLRLRKGLDMKKAKAQSLSFYSLSYFEKQLIKRNFQKVNFNFFENSPVLKKLNTRKGSELLPSLYNVFFQITEQIQPQSVLSSARMSSPTSLIPVTFIGTLQSFSFQRILDSNPFVRIFLFPQGFNLFQAEDTFSVLLQKKVPKVSHCLAKALPFGSATTKQWNISSYFNEIPGSKATDERSSSDSSTADHTHIDQATRVGGPASLVSSAAQRSWPDSLNVGFNKVHTGETIAPQTFISSLFHCIKYFPMQSSDLFSSQKLISGWVIKKPLLNSFTQTQVDFIANPEYFTEKLRLTFYIPSSVNMDRENGEKTYGNKLQENLTKRLFYFKKLGIMGKTKLNFLSNIRLPAPLVNFPSNLTSQRLYSLNSLNLCTMNLRQRFHQNQKLSENQKFVVNIKSPLTVFSQPSKPVAQLQSSLEKEDLLTMSVGLRDSCNNKAEYTLNTQLRGLLNYATFFL